MRNLKIIYLFFILIGAFQSNAQEIISEVIQESKVANKDKNALYFIDFWATWCGPCKHASEYLTYFQKINPTNFYVVSMTKENGDLVKEHLKKHPTDLAVVTDYNGLTHKKYNVKSLPYGVLLNASGKVLWKGNAVDIKDKDIKYFLQKNKSTIHKNKFFKVTKDSNDGKKIELYKPNKDFEVKEVCKNKIEEGLNVGKRDEYKRITGPLNRIISYLLKIDNNQLSMNASMNKHYEIFANEYFSDYEIFQHLLEDLSLVSEKKEQEGKVLFLDLKMGSNKFWDETQIVWEEGTPSFLIDDFQIKANNVNFNEIKYQLSYLLKMPIIITGQQYDLDMHDWEIHYKFPNLMKENLKEYYGIEADIKNSYYPSYIIQKK